jgi:hypothetical protein
MRDRVSELLAKAIKRGALDQEIITSDKERAVEFLQVCRTDSMARAGIVNNSVTLCHIIPAPNFDNRLAMVR